MRDKINNLAKRESVRQLVKYGIVGIIGLIIALVVYNLLVVRLSVHYPFSSFISRLLRGWMSVDMIDILISNVISDTLAIINNFFLNSYFTFKVTDKKLKRFASFAGVAVIGLVISSLLLTLFIEGMGMGEMIAKVFAIFIVAAIQFGINKLFTFKQR